MYNDVPLYGRRSVRSSLFTKDRVCWIIGEELMLFGIFIPKVCVYNVSACARVAWFVGRVLTDEFTVHGGVESVPC